MGIVQVKKVVAVCFLEATKLTLEHLGEYRLTLSQQSIAGSPQLPRLYGETRRLRDYLQRCASAYQDVVDLDFSEEDARLLVACCRRAVDMIDLRLMGEQVSTHDERQWLQKKRTVLSDWAVEFASKPPLLELPVPRLSPTQTEGAKALMVRLHQKLFDSGHLRAAVPDAVPMTSLTAGLPGLVGAAVPDADYAPAQPIGEPPPERRSARPPVADSAPPIQHLLESGKIRDPRLRALVALDLRSYERSLACQDLRIAAVLLASILEAAVIDHALTRRSELGLAATPDTWNPLDVLVRIMGDDFSPKDRSVAYSLFASRNLLRPSLQIVTPTVVTTASLERLQEFAHRAFHSMGFTSSHDDSLDKLPPMLRKDQPSIGKPMSE